METLTELSNGMVLVTTGGIAVVKLNEYRYSMFTPRALLAAVVTLTVYFTFG
jgi:hypothetical protein